MTRWPVIFIKLLSVAVVITASDTIGADVILKSNSVKPNTTTLTVGYLTAIKGELKDKQGLGISGAITMALEKVNNDTELLPNVTLVLRWNDTKGDTVLATRAITEMICDGVAVFIGPEGPCYTEAVVAQSRNIPMISYRCSDYMASGIPTFARTEPPDTQVTKSVISLINYYHWSKFSIIYEKDWAKVASSLKEQAISQKMKINHCEEVPDQNNCCTNNLECCSSNYWYQVIQNTKNGTRIYVFLGAASSLFELMTSMDRIQLFEKGEYLVIFVDMMTYSKREAMKYLYRPENFDSMRTCDDFPNFLKRARSLLVVVSTPPTNNYENFTSAVQSYSLKDPFNFTMPDIFLRKYTKVFVSIYAAYLYDAILLYAQALHELLKNETRVLTGDVIEEIVSNGTRIIQTIIDSKEYHSITGSNINIDKNGDSEGNFSVLALKEDNFQTENFTCNYHMVPVASFHKNNSDFPEYKIINASIRIDWVNEKPNDEPSCGFRNEKCPKDESYIISMVAAGVLALILFCAGVITLSIYRKWKIELEIEGLLWKIDSHEIRGYFNNDIVSSPSKLSLASAASFGSRCSNQVFTATGRFRGVIVRIKELKFARKKDISRDVMKEMRLLRDLRQDNINSFIGACVEPMRILLVTDYCAKGSLYDIIENEDIKLDDLFIASLIHDLIKGMIFIHNSSLVFHGNLKSSNCVVTSRWMLQVTDFGLHDLRHCAESESIGEHQHYRNLLWKAPELLRNTNIYGSQKGDVYAFAIILYEIIGRKGPYGQVLEPKEIIGKVKSVLPPNAEPFRPDIECITDTGLCPDYVVTCIKDCWDEHPEMRPDFPSIRIRLKKMRGGKSKNIMDQMMEMMEKYANNLEDIVNERTRLLCEEKRKTEDLLHRMLPLSVAEKLTKGHGVEPVSYDAVTIYFSDIVGFTAMSAESTPLQVVNFLNDLYTVFDRIIKGYDVYKVETIGDAYMVVSGLPISNGDRHVGEIASMSLELLQAVRSHKISHRPNETLKLRIGMHTGPVVAGVVGLTMPRYCLFGDTVNTASRMESNGEALRIHISDPCKESLERLGGYIMESRGLISLKGKGEVNTYWLVGATEEAIQKRNVDLGDLPPPLFCRPRKSPKFNCDSRQPSLINLNYGGSRRQSSVPRTDIDSTYSLQGSINHRDSPHLLQQRLVQIPLYLQEGLHSTSETSEMENIALIEHDPSSRIVATGSVGSREQFNKKPSGSRFRPRHAMQSMPSTDDCRTTTTTFNNLDYTLRGTQSLDPFPSQNFKNRLENTKLPERLPKLLPPPPTSFDDCSGSSAGGAVAASISTSAQHHRNIDYSLYDDVEYAEEENDDDGDDGVPEGDDDDDDETVEAGIVSQNGGGDYGDAVSRTSVIAAPVLVNRHRDRLLNLDDGLYSKHINNNCNGSIGSEDPNCPLLMRQNSLSSPHDEVLIKKRWRSLEIVGGGSGNGGVCGGSVGSRAVCGPTDESRISNKKTIASWFAGFFQGNGFRSSDASLRKIGVVQSGVRSMAGFGEIPAAPEKESIV